MKELTLLQEARIERKRRQSEKWDLDINKNSRSQIIQKLLPGYIIQDKPKLFHDSIKPDKYLIGGYGSGKTYTFCAEAIFLSWINRPAPVLLVIQTQSNSSLTTAQTLKKMCDENALDYTEKDVKGVVHFDIQFGTKKQDIAHLLLASGYNPDSLAGLTVSAAGIDECFLQKKETHDIVISRVRDSRAKVNEVFFASTIKPLEMEWGHEVCENDFKGTDRILKVNIPTTENKFAPVEFIDRMRQSYSEEDQQVFIEGKNIYVRGKAVYRFKDETKKSFDKLILPKAGRSMIKLLFGFDFNVGIMTSGEIWLDGRIRRQIDEYKIHDSNTEELCQLMVNRLMDKYPGITDQHKQDYSINIFMDAAAKQRKSSAKLGVTDAYIVRDAFVNAGFNALIHIPNENPPVRDRVQHTNNLLDKEDFVIYDNCKHSIMCRKFTKWKEGADGFSIVTTGLWSHMSAAVDYALWHSQRMVDNYDDSEEYNSPGGGIVVMDEREFK